MGLSLSGSLGYRKVVLVCRPGAMAGWPSMRASACTALEASDSAAMSGTYSSEALPIVTVTAVCGLCLCVLVLVLVYG